MMNKVKVKNDNKVRHAMTHRASETLLQTVSFGGWDVN